MRRALILLALLAAGCDPAEEPCGGAGIICSLAGTGEQGFNGDGLAPEATALNLPSAVRLGPDGLLYLMDFNNWRLRRRTAQGTIDTVAGNGVHDIAVPGAAARDTPLENPIDFAFAPDGRVMFVSLHDPRVLAVEHDGTVAVIAGTGEVGDAGDDGPANMALFNELAALTVAPDGSIFVSDDGANRVRVIRPDGTVRAYAGDGEQGNAGDGGPASEAQLYHPEGLALDTAGNLYIADTLNHRIRRVVAETGTIETFAGNGGAGLAGDGGPATAAELKWPNGVSVAPDGQLYISDTFNHRIRRVDLEGVITTVAGSSEGHAGDGGLAVEAKLKGPAYIEATDTALYIADMQNQSARILWLR